MNETVILAGGTGLIGRQLAALLVEQGRDVHLLLRRQSDRDYGTATIHIADPSTWPEMIARVQPDIFISCLGSTMKKAGSKQAFAAVDRDLVGELGKAAKSSGARHCLAVSSTMADPDASSFYLKVKGEAEQLLRQQQFDRLDLVRPGLLRGERVDDPRLGESLAIIASPLLDRLLHGKLRRYRSIASRDVAKAMAALLETGEKGAFVHENDEIWHLAGKSRS